MTVNLGQGSTHLLVESKQSRLSPPIVHSLAPSLPPSLPPSPIARYTPDHLLTLTLLTRDPQNSPPRAAREKRPTWSGQASQAWGRGRCFWRARRSRAVAACPHGRRAPTHAGSIDRGPTPAGPHETAVRTAAAAWTRRSSSSVRGTRARWTLDETSRQQRRVALHAFDV